MPAETRARRTSRAWLYTPFLLLALLAAGWSGFWLFARGKVEQQLDAALAREAQAGRNWTCRDRSVGGYPFRIEVRCAALGLTSTRWGEEVRLASGPALAVAQATSFGHVILQFTGPMTATLPQGRSAALAWTRLESSLRFSGLAFERLSLVAEAPALTVQEPGQPAQETWRAAGLEAHLRPHPQRFTSEQAVDLALDVKGGAMPALDALLGSSDVTDLVLQATATRSFAFRRGVNPAGLEAWRGEGGAVELTRLELRKGQARASASGRFALDEAHRPAGQLDAAVAGIERIAGIRIGGGLAAGLGALLGGRPPVPQNEAAAGLTPLPPLVLREGRVFLGPIRLPLQPLAPLY